MRRRHIVCEVNYDASFCRYWISYWSDCWVRNVDYGSVDLDEEEETYVCDVYDASFCRYCISYWSDCWVRNVGYGSVDLDEEEGAYARGASHFFSSGLDDDEKAAYVHDVHLFHRGLDEDEEGAYVCGASHFFSSVLDDGEEAAYVHGANYLFHSGRVHIYGNFPLYAANFQRKIRLLLVLKTLFSWPFSI
jgi:hypothetical protein